MSWILDVVFFVILIGGILIGVHRGFIAGICKIAGTILAIFVAVSFCVTFQFTLDKWFNLTHALSDAVHNDTAGYWIAVAISFVILVILTKLVAWLLGKLGTALIDKINAFSVINRLFGGLLGLVKAAIFLFLLLTLCRYLIQWFNWEGVQEFISSSTVVGAIFNWDWFIEATKFTFLLG